MKKLLLLLFVLFSLKPKAQVVFCPPGAEWHYLFSGSMFFPGNTYNETIKYIGDSISGTDTIKILSHFRFFLQCSPTVSKTLIKQKGDTIFFYNKRTQNSWQILYNFAAPAGQGWQTTVLQSNNTAITFSYTVGSVDYVTVNGFSLRRLILYGLSTTIIERFGCDQFLFNYSNSGLGFCDGNGFLEFLCYKDNLFGTKQFGDKSCTYYTSNGVGINEEKLNEAHIKVYPNPTKDLLTVESEKFGTTTSICLYTIKGQKVLNIDEISTAGVQFNLGKLEKGIYILKVFNNEELMATEKIIKE